MGLHAVDVVEDAVERSKEILFPFDLGIWSRLALIVLFVGGAGFGSMFTNIPASDTGSVYTDFEDANMNTKESSNSFGDSSVDLEEAVARKHNLGGLGMATIAGVVALLLFIGLIFMYLSSVFKFVMFRSIREKDVSIRENFAKHYIDGFKYFMFNLGIAAFALAVVAGIVLGFMSNLVLGVSAILIAVPIFVLLAVFTGIVHDFALQEIIVEDAGFIESVKSSLSQVTDDWKQFGGYLLIRLVVSWAVSLLSFFVFGAISLAALIVLGLLSFALFMLFAPIGMIAALISFIVWFVAVLFGRVPFQTYLYSYFVELYDAFMG
jgi:hypothetical protein